MPRSAAILRATGDALIRPVAGVADAATVAGGAATATGAASSAGGSAAGGRFDLQLSSDDAGPLGQGHYGFRFNPTIVDGVMYVLADGSDLVALNAATGKEIWRTHFEGGFGQRGINYWESEDGADRRLFLLNNGLLRAISADSGKVIGQTSFFTGDDLVNDKRQGVSYVSEDVGRKLASRLSESW